jgi:hypothetical protein
MPHLRGLRARQVPSLAAALGAACLLGVGLLGAAYRVDAQGRSGVRSGAREVHGPRGPASDPALAVAEEIRRRVGTFPNFRGQVPHGVFTEDPARVFAVRATPVCLEELDRRAVAHEAFRTGRSPIPAPVRLEGGIGGVRFRKLREGAPFIVACELAARLPALAAVLRAHDVVEAQVLSSWRLEPRTSFHTMGLALDVARFVRSDGSVLDVERDYPLHPDVPTCEGVDPRPTRDPAAALEALACDLAARAGLSTVITPDYSEGHRDHLHLDVRPDDPRLFVR